GVAVYRDYLSPTGKDYVLAFAGTEMEIADIMTDIVQGIGLSGTIWNDVAKLEQQYRDAMLLADDLGTRLKARGASVRSTGHSLGGGLASAASVGSSWQPMPANTFNAAGLHENTVTFRLDGILSPRVPLTPRAFDRYATELAGTGIVNAFTTKYDPLTFAQENLGGLPLVQSIPKAIGRQIRLNSPFDRQIEQGMPDLKATLSGCPIRFPGEPHKLWSVRFNLWMTDVVASSGTFLRMAPHHKISSVEWGLMVEETAIPVPRRIFDIFGDPDPGK
ncbi:MAG: hypothetical protein ACKO3T_28595, partial [Planctomycetaceae bacterium]